MSNKRAEGDEWSVVEKGFAFADCFGTAAELSLTDAPLLVELTS